MKLKSKLVLASASLLVLSGIAAGTGAYAWYSANRQVGLGLNNITATAETTALSASVVATKGTFTGATGEVLTTSTATPLNFAFNEKLTDVSGVGNGTFYKPMFGTGSYGNASSTDTTTAANVIGSWDETKYETMYADKTNGDTLWYLQFTITFKAEGTEKVSLYFNGDSTVTDTGSTLPVAAAVRLSAYADTTEMFYANPNGTGGAYVTDVTSNAYNAGTTSTKILDATASTGFFVKKHVYGGSELSLKTTPTEGLTAYNSSSIGYLGDLAPVTGTPATLAIKFTVWVEGSDEDCKLDATHFAGAFNMGLSFYSVVQSTMEQAA